MQYVADFFSSIWDTCVSIFSLLASLVDVLLSCVSFLIDCFTALPSWLNVAAFALVCCSVLYKILGRESSD